MSTTFKRWGQSELLPRYIFAESIIKHQRVLEIGAVASTEGMSAYFLLIRGARTVVACDSVLEATQQAQARFGAPNLAFRPMVFDGLAPASFDLIAITDLAPFIHAPALFERLLRLLAPQGYVLGALRNAAGLALSQVMEADLEEPPPSYGQLMDVLMPRFMSIQMATQAPVLGYQLAFEEGDGLQIEGSLAGAGEAAYYIVIAGKEPRTGLDPLWVQLPPEPLAFNGSKLEEAILRARNWQIRFEEQKGAFEKTKAQLETLDRESQHQARQLNEAQETLSRLQSRPESPIIDASTNIELSEKVSRLSTDLSVAEGRANMAEARVSAMSMEIQRHVQALREATTDALAAKETVRLERAKREEAEAKAEELMARATQTQEPTTQSQSLVAEQQLEVEKARLEVDSQKATIETLQHKLEALQEQHSNAANMQSEALSAAADKEFLLMKLQEQERAVRMLQADLGAMREERDALSFQLRTNALKRDEDVSGGVSKEVEGEVQRGVVEGADGKELQALNSRIQELEGKLNQQTDEMDAMREDLTLRSHSVERSKNRIRELESMLANAQTQSREDHALLGAEYEKLKQDNVSLTSMLESLREKFEAQKTEETNADTHTAGAMLLALRKRYAEQEQVLTQTREALECTEGELAVVHKQLKTLLQEHKSVTPTDLTERGIASTTDDTDGIPDIEEIEIEELEPE